MVRSCLYSKSFEDPTALRGASWPPHIAFKCWGQMHHPSLVWHTIIPTLSHTHTHNSAHIYIRVCSDKKANTCINLASHKYAQKHNVGRSWNFNRVHLWFLDLSINMSYESHVTVERETRTQLALLIVMMIKRVMMFSFRSRCGINILRNMWWPYTTHIFLSAG